MFDWNTAEVERLTQLWNAGILSATLIAEEMHCSRNAIIGKVYRLGLTARKPKLSAPARPREQKRSANIMKFPHAPQDPDPLPPEVPAAPGIAPVELMDLRFEHCRAIVGSSAQTGLAVYCGAPKEIGSYCSHHGRHYYNFQARVR